MREDISSRPPIGLAVREERRFYLREGMEVALL